MTNRPKRRISKENPYRINYYENKNLYTVTFIDSRKELQEIEITFEIFNVLNNFELMDLSQMNKDDLHRDCRVIDDSDESEIIIYNYSLKKQKFIEELVEEKINKERLKVLINELPLIQRNRLKKYYFEDKTFEEIAKEEQCSKVAVKYSIDNAIKNISKKFKN